MKTILLAFSLLLAACCGENTFAEAELELPERLTLSTVNPDQRAFVDRSSSFQTWFYFANTWSGDAIYNHSPIRLSLTVPPRAGSYSLAYPDGGMFFRDDDLKIDCFEWNGRVTWETAFHGWALAFEATCVSDPGVVVSGHLRGL